jgi:hypothetical protein
MKRTLVKRLSLALMGLALAASGSIGSAQTTNITWNFDIDIPPVTFWYGSVAVASSWDPTMDASSNVASGSLRLDETWPPADQFAIWIGFDYAGGTSVSVNMDPYATEQFDIRVDPNSTMSANGDFGTLMVSLNINWGQVQVGTYVIPAAATNGWQHVSLPIAKGLGSAWGPAFQMQAWNPSGGSPLGPVTVWIDNLSFVAEGPTPKIASQPVPQEVFAGRNVNWSVIVTGGEPLTFHWRKGTTPLTDGPTGSGSTITGSTTNALTIANVSAADIANYSVVVTNTFGSVTSSVVSLAIVAPADAYAVATLASQPLAFFELNETSNPATSPAAFDHVGGFAGTYGTTVSNAFSDIAGPRLADGFSGFTANNAAVQFPGASGGKITLPPLNLNTNTATFTAWIYPTAVVGDAGIVFSRAGSTCAGLCWAGTSGALGYNWNNNSAAWSWQGGPLPPMSEWSFVALVITPDDATVYCINSSGGLTSGNNAVVNANQAFDGQTLMGQDGMNAGRTFAGSIDNVAIYNRSLSQTELQALYDAASGARMLVLQGLSLSWVNGTLLEATSVTGPWTPVSDATSPYTIVPTGPSKFYQVQYP